MTQREDEMIRRKFLINMQQNDSDAWIKARDIIEKIYKQSAQLSGVFQRQIKGYIIKIKNMLVLFYIYSLSIDFEYSLQSHYKDKFIQLVKADRCYSNIKEWLENQTQNNKILTIQLIVQFAPKFMCNKLNIIKISDLQFLLIYFNKFSINKERQVEISISFIANLQKIRISTNKQFQHKQLAIIRLICEILEKQKEGKGNMNLIFDAYLIGDAQDKNIESFCYYFNHYILELDEEKLIKIFIELSKNSINYSVVLFINKISKILAEEEQFYKLRFLFEQFILPNIVRRAKACTKQKVQLYVLNLCQFYTIGFLMHCDIGQFGLQCILSNVQQVTSQNYRVRWLKLAYLVANKYEMQGKWQKKALQMNFKADVIQKIRKDKSANKDYQIWQITTRNIKKHKIYKSFIPNYKGMENEAIQCYIISNVQALFMTKTLPSLIKRIDKPKDKSLIKLFSNVFSKLQSNNNQLVSVNQLQRNGPQFFAQSKQQEDAQQYLLSIMDQLQRQMRQYNLLQEFRSIFEIKCIHNIICKNCKHQIYEEQSSYVHTISFQEKFKLIYEENLNDYTCEKCKQLKCIKKTQLKLSNKIFILHINRFSVHKGQTKKELPTQPILRKFDDYQLVGIIFHIGKQMQCGHYVYYSREDRRKWVQFNDCRVNGIQLQKQDQQFQRSMKAQKTPYILFYKKK